MTAKSTSVRNLIGIGMAETTEKTGEKTLSVAPTKTLTLKGRGVEQGVVRQSFSHGRTKAVVVEKVKSRVPTRAKVEAPNASASPPPSGPSSPARLPPRLSTPRPRHQPRLRMPQAGGRAGPAQPDRRRAEGARPRPQRCPAARSGRAQDRGRGSCRPQVTRGRRARRARRRGGAQGG
jgi:translation initiation factor IF-2